MGGDPQGATDQGCDTQQAGDQEVDGAFAVVMTGLLLGQAQVFHRVSDDDVDLLLEIDTVLARRPRQGAGLCHVACRGQLGDMAAHGDKIFYVALDRSQHGRVLRRQARFPLTKLALQRIDILVEAGHEARQFRVVFGNIDTARFHDGIADQVVKPFATPGVFVGVIVGAHHAVVIGYRHQPQEGDE